jgi:hypothetical protein
MRDSGNPDAWVFGDEPQIPRSLIHLPFCFV